jgi:putative endonuclease
VKIYFYSYALVSLKDGSLYIGLTSDVARRLREHNAGYNRSTTSHYPYRLLVSKKFSNRAEAREQEKKWKSSSGRQSLRELIAKETIQR